MNSHSAATSTSATSRPPFYWKVPGIEKDYMYDNVQRIRKVNAQNRLKTEPMKAAFIPGVTKNAKYAHITSRVGEIMRHPSERGAMGDGGFGNGRSKFSSFSSNGRIPQTGNHTRGSYTDSRMGVNSMTNGPVNRRLSRSSTDLASLAHAKKKTALVNSASAASLTNSQPQFKGQKQIGVEGPGNYVPRSKRKPKGLQIEDESVYNWRFSDNNVDSPVPPQEWNGRGNPKIKNYHRVEYLPCDGICAEETIEERVSDGSGRSSSRTSRGINTEETRIIEDLQSLDLQDPPNNAYNQSFSSENFHRSTPNPPRESNEPKTNGESDYFLDQPYITGDKRNDTSSTPRKQAVMKDVSSSSMKPVASVLGSGRSSRTGMGTGPELPHTLGTVPKYLKQRQEEWKTEADKVAAAQPSPDVPPGHILLPEQERLETLADLKSKYALLIDELNRVPIRIDTMRVREYKIQLEQQLQKLERGMAIFSRSRVFVKLPDGGPISDSFSK